MSTFRDVLYERIRTCFHRLSRLRMRDGVFSLRLVILCKCILLPTVLVAHNTKAFPLKARTLLSVCKCKRTKQPARVPFSFNFCFAFFFNEQGTRALNYRLMNYDDVKLKFSSNFSENTRIK